MTKRSKPFNSTVKGNAQEAYARSVRMLIQFYGKTPDRSPNRNFRTIFFNEKMSIGGLPIPCGYAIAAYASFEQVLQRNWHILGILRAQTERRLPAILSVEEVRKLLAPLKPPELCLSFHRILLRSETSRGTLSRSLRYRYDRMMIHVHRGKGAKDRYVPLPQSTLNLLRTIGSPTAILLSSFQPLAEPDKGSRRLRLPWPKAVSKGPSVEPSLLPKSQKNGLRSYPPALLCHSSFRGRG